MPPLELDFYARLFDAARSYLGSPVPADPEAIVRAQMSQREETFLELARKIVFEDASHPYRELFKSAGCEFADLASSVRTLGLEETLDRLLNEGVYLSHDEFKGKRAVLRAGKETRVSPTRLRNPLVAKNYESLSGGSSGQPLRTPKSLTFQLHAEAWRHLQHRVWAVELHVPLSMFPSLPSTIFWWTSLSQVRMGRPYRAWFPHMAQGWQHGFYRWATRALVARARAAGVPLPWPRFLPPGGETKVAEWIANHTRQGRCCAVWCFTTSAVRVARSAAERGLDISGTVFLCGSEPITPARRVTLSRAGTRAWGQYHISEVGLIGTACPAMEEDNDFHISADIVAVRSRHPPVHDSNSPLSVLYFTTLLPAAPHFLINVDMGDAGELGPANCSCLLSELGFKTVIRRMYSYTKLKACGATLASFDLVHILEEVMPRQLGGVAGDYQLVEQEVGGEPVLRLRVSPRTGIRDALRVREFFLDQVQRCYGGSLATGLWRQASALRVEFIEPEITAAGKVLPVRTLIPKNHES